MWTFDRTAVVTALACALAGCTSSGGRMSLEDANVAVQERTTGFRPFVARSGESYDMAASLDKLGGATILLVRGNATSPVIADIDAATTRVTAAAREYAAARICTSGPVGDVAPARAGGAYDLELNGWGYKVLCEG